MKLNISNEIKKMVSSTYVSEKVYDKLEKLSVKHKVTKQRIIALILEQVIDSIEE